jgi:hypothetical protein
VGVAVMEAVVEVAEERRRVEEEGEAAAAAGLWGGGGGGGGGGGTGGGRAVVGSAAVDSASSTTGSADLRAEARGISHAAREVKGRGGVESCRDARTVWLQKSRLPN